MEYMIKYALFTLQRVTQSILLHYTWKRYDTSAVYVVYPLQLIRLQYELMMTTEVTHNHHPYTSNLIQVHLTHNTVNVQ